MWCGTDGCLLSRLQQRGNVVPESIVVIGHWTTVSLSTASLLSRRLCLLYCPGVVPVCFRQGRSGIMLFNAINACKPHQKSIHSLGSDSTLLRFRSKSCSRNLGLGLGGLVCCYGPVKLGCQSTRHMTNSSYGQLVKKSTRHSQLVTRPTRHIV